MERFGNTDWFDALVLQLRENVAEIGGRIAVAVLILLGGWLLARFAGKAVYAAIMRHERGQTLAPLMRSTVRFVIFGVSGVMALDQLGIPIATVLAGAGIVGLAVGFGAQALVKDVITGFFHIMQGVLRVGDVAQVGDVTGVVEEVNLRLTHLRTFNGQLWYVPNGLIERVGSYNRGWCRAVADVSVAFDHDVPRALRVLREVGEAYQAEKPELVLEPPEAQGIMGFGASTIALRLVLKVKAQEHWGVERDLRIRIKEAFDREGIELPYPRQVILTRPKGDGPAEAA